MIVLLPFLRPLRAARVLRLLRLVSVAGRLSVDIRRLMGRRGFTPFLVVVGEVVSTCGVGVWMVERDAEEHAELVERLDRIEELLANSSAAVAGDGQTS